MLADTYNESRLNSLEIRIVHSYYISMFILPYDHRKLALNSIHGNQMLLARGVLMYFFNFKI